MQATKPTGQSCPNVSVYPTSDNFVPKPCPRCPSLECILNDIAHDLGYHSRQNLPATLSNKQTAKILHLSPDTLALWRSTGRYHIPYQKIGRTIRYPVQSLAHFIQSRTFSHTQQKGAVA